MSAPNRWIGAVSLVLLGSLALGCQGGSGTGTSAGAAVAVNVSPTALSMLGGDTVRLVASVTGTADARVTWSVLEATTDLSVSSDGSVFAVLGTAGQFHVRAVSVASPGAQATVTVQVVRPSVTVSVVPDFATLFAGDALALSATVAGSPHGGVLWSLDQTIPGATISTDGVLATPSLTSGALRVRATSIANPTVYSTADVLLFSGVGSRIVPSAATLRVGQTIPLAAVISGATNHDVIWAVAEQGGGAVSDSGVYTAPSAPGTYHAHATSVADPAQTAVCTITVKAALDVAVSPGMIDVIHGHRQQFSALASGVPSTAVWWSVVEGPPCGTIDASGLYTASGSTGACHVRAASIDQPSATGLAEVNVLPALELAPHALTAQSLEVFSVTALGADAIGKCVSWTIDELNGNGATLVCSAGSPRWDYPAPSVPGTYHIRARTTVSPAHEAVAELTVVPRPTRTVAGVLEGADGPVTLRLNGDSQSVIRVLTNVIAR